MVGPLGFELVLDRGEHRRAVGPAPGFALLRIGPGLPQIDLDPVKLLDVLEHSLGENRLCAR